MRFALLGNHPDGLDMACCMLDSGRHVLVAYTSASVSEVIGKHGGGPGAKVVTDLEEILADPSVEAVIVASGPGHRAAHLRRALQSERDVLCVHPPDATTDLAHEAAMLQSDTGHVLLPLIHEALHPAVRRLADLLHSGEARAGALQWVAVHHQSTSMILTNGGQREDRLSLPDWLVLRHLGGELAEVSAFAVREELAAEEPLLVSGRFEKCGLFQTAFLPNRPQSCLKFTVTGQEGALELTFPLGDPGPAFLTWRDRDGEQHEEAWEIWDPWPTLLHLFEEAVSGRRKKNKEGAAADDVSWQDSIRCLELDDAVRRSVEKRCTCPLEYPEATEEVGFKGTMTLVGCGLLWALILLAILAIWLPYLGWLVVPVLFIFLILQSLRWIIPSKEKAGADTMDKGMNEQNSSAR